MCIIVDANVASELSSASNDARPVLTAIVKGGLKIVSGHKLKSELLNTPFKRLYRQLVLSGRIVEFENGAVERELTVIAKGTLKSNDGHIIALARVSGARVLFSRDADLHADFKDANLINRPRGSVYQSRDHEHLLREEPCSCN